MKVKATTCSYYKCYTRGLHVLKIQKTKCITKEFALDFKCTGLQSPKLCSMDYPNLQAKPKQVIKSYSRKSTKKRERNQLESMFHYLVHIDNERPIFKLTKINQRNIEYCTALPKNYSNNTSTTVKKLAHDALPHSMCITWITPYIPQNQGFSFPFYLLITHYITKNSNLIGQLHIPHTLHN